MRGAHPYTQKAPPASRRLRQHPFRNAGGASSGEESSTSHHLAAMPLDRRGGALHHRRPLRVLPRAAHILPGRREEPPALRAEPAGARVRLHMGRLLRHGRVRPGGRGALGDPGADHRHPRLGGLRGGRLHRLLLGPRGPRGAPAGGPGAEHLRPAGQARGGGVLQELRHDQGRRVQVLPHLRRPLPRRRRRLGGQVGRADHPLRRQVEPLRPGRGRLRRHDHPRRRRPEGGRGGPGQVQPLRRRRQEEEQGRRLADGGAGAGRAPDPEGPGEVPAAPGVGDPLAAGRGGRQGGEGGAQQRERDQRRRLRRLRRPRRRQVKRDRAHFWPGRPAFCRPPRAHTVIRSSSV
mmetsp:Transcript_93353/g.264276  ORF Transcript_93353/g.264276 Transcript_93353/m.264276 type:complete len:349 (-) Transcript_93353:158-1204(-)